MGFNNLQRQITGRTSPSHMWIALHRLVEAYCRTVAQPFSEVFADLERQFGFSRTDSKRWPDLETMRAAASHLRMHRDLVLTERRRLIAEQRIAKKKGDRKRVPLPLKDASDRSRAYAATVPRVGWWGWRKRRESSS